MRIRKRVGDENKEQVGWQIKFWEHQIRDERDYSNHAEYIHYNPVKHGLVKAPKDWEYSMFRRYAKAGVYDINWGETEEIKFDDGVGNE
ncbi:transposase [Thermodesulfobacteriota bacterium]